MPPGPFLFFSLTSLTRFFSLLAFARFRETKPLCPKWAVSPRDFRFPDYDVFGFFAVDDARRAYLCFSGTRDLDREQWETNLDLDRVDTPGKIGGKVLEGIAEAWETAETTLMSSYLEPNLAKFDTLYVTGHSLGGSLTLLGGAMLGDLLRNHVVRAVAFGAPRIGDEGFRTAAQACVSAMYCVENDGDPVPRLPPTDSLCAPGDVVLLHNNKTWSTAPTGYARHSFSPLVCHSIDQYVDFLDGATEAGAKGNGAGNNGHDGILTRARRHCVIV